MIEWIIDVIESVGLLGVAFLSFLEVVIPIIPSEIVLPFSGFVASRGDLGLIGVIVAATIGSVAGSVVLYYLADWFGWERIQAIVSKYGKYLGVKQKDVDKAADYFDSHENWFVLFGRFIPGVRSVIAIPAGLRKMPIASFVGISTIGAAVWNIILVYAGFRLGEDYEKIEEWIGPVSKVVVVLVVLGAIGWIAYRRFSEKKPTK